MKNIKAIIFDAYGTLFDVNSAAEKCKSKIGDKWESFANYWRKTQLEYTWLRSLMGRHKDFWQITEDSLDKSMQAFNINKAMKNELLDLYKILSPYPEVKETLEKSSLKSFSVNDLINLERAMKLGERLDGHLVQGHVDGVAKCLGVSVNDGSWIYKFEFDISNEMLLIEKGSICINGVSLTVFDIAENTFKVTIIPYTYENTSFKTLKEGDIVNIEFDMIGKYLARFNK